MRRLGLSVPSRLLVVSTAAGAIALAGCGTTEIDHAKAEKLIRQSVASLGQTTVKSATCPSGVKPHKGGTLTCHLTVADGTKGTVTIHMLDDKGKIEIKGPGDFHAD